MSIIPAGRRARRDTPRAVYKCEWWQSYADEARQVTRLFYPRPKKSEVFPLSPSIANRIRKLIEHGYEAEELKDWFRLRSKPSFSRAETNTTKSNNTFEYIKSAYGNKCVYCGRKKPLTKDHIIPLAKGGKDEMANIVPACRECNCKKNRRSLEELGGVEALQYHIFN